MCLPYALQYNPLLIVNLSLILVVHKARILRKKNIPLMKLAFKKWAENIQTKTNNNGNNKYGTLYSSVPNVIPEFSGY